jgi:1-aminocyclopropane-1-carboxylate deaminase
MKREDLIHKYISGNKFRKLKYNILEAKNQQKNTLLTFGGAYSNHISATAYAGKLFNFKTIGIIRGEELANNLSATLEENSTLKFASEQGMKFEFISREDYKNKSSKLFLKQLEHKFGDFYLIPEGGTNKLAIKGCKEILTNSDHKFDYICTAVGTGGTIAGLIDSAENNQKIIGFSTLKGDFLNKEIQNITTNKTNWKLNTDFHFGGFAKINKQLVTFINEFKEIYKIKLDPIYTGKMMFGVNKLIEDNYFKNGTQILAIHTGGLQGINSINKILKKKNQQQIN